MKANAEQATQQGSKHCTATGQHSSRRRHRHRLRLRLTHTHTHTHRHTQTAQHTARARTRARLSLLLARTQIHSRARFRPISKSLTYSSTTHTRARIRSRCFRWNRFGCKHMQSTLTCRPSHRLVPSPSDKLWTPHAPLWRECQRATRPVRGRRLCI